MYKIDHPWGEGEPSSVSTRVVTQHELLERKTKSDFDRVDMQQQQQHRENVPLRRQPLSSQSSPHISIPSYIKSGGGSLGSGQRSSSTTARADAMIADDMINKLNKNIDTLTRSITIDVERATILNTKLTQIEQITTAARVQIHEQRVNDGDAQSDESFQPNNNNGQYDTPLMARRPQRIPDSVMSSSSAPFMSPGAPGHLSSLHHHDISSDSPLREVEDNIRELMSQSARLRQEHTEITARITGARQQCDATRQRCQELQHDKHRLEEQVALLAKTKHGNRSLLSASSSASAAMSSDDDENNDRTMLTHMVERQSELLADCEWKLVDARIATATALAQAQASSSAASGRVSPSIATALVTT
jgi:chromosome segregation ATPase